MPPEDRGTDMSEMRTPLDTLQGETAEGLPEYDMQEYAVERDSVKMTSYDYRITVFEFDRPDKMLILEYPTTYQGALERLDSLCDDEDLVKAYGKFLTVELSVSYTLPDRKEWVAVNRQFCYPSD